MRCDEWMDECGGVRGVRGGKVVLVLKREREWLKSREEIER